jgi:RNA polymerase sigma-70 factor (ECF subfamily)
MAQSQVSEQTIGGADESQLLSRLRAGDERAFEELVDRFHPMMLAVARTHVKTQAAAEEVAQEAWLGVLKGLDSFEGRSSLKTWIMRILVNNAITRGVRDTRSIPFSSLATEETEGAPVVDPDRFRAQGGAFGGHWNGYPGNWNSMPEQALFSRETFERVQLAIQDLPPAQQTVITLRDIEGWESREVCAALEISEGNQRLLLHRARSGVRSALEGHLDA